MFLIALSGCISACDAATTSSRGSHRSTVLTRSEATRASSKPIAMEQRADGVDRREDKSSSSGPSHPHGRSSHAIELSLRRALESEGAVPQLRVTYDDRHGLHGGFMLSLGPDGTLRQEVQAPASKNVGRLRAKITTTQMSELVRLLLNLEAWQSSGIGHELRPDESLARLIISDGTNRSEISELFNEVSPTSRIGQIRKKMTDLAWHTP